VSSELSELLARTRYLLLDFDGPICAIFAGRPARSVVLELLQLAAAEGVEIPEDIELARDPFEVLRFAATVSVALAERVERALAAAEVCAVDTAAATEGAVAVIDAWRDAGRRVAVVSNNSAAAVRAYLAAHGIDVEAVVARANADPALLKPSPHLVVGAIEALHGTPSASVFVGDSVSDVEAAKAAHVQCIGYANKPGKHERLAAAGASVVIDDMRALSGVTTLARNR
jgi:HAD superfamily hydrolase (TIGR01549 family)